MAESMDNRVNLLTGRLRNLHLHAGEPSVRAVASRTGGVVSHSTVHQALSGRRIPRWGALELIIEALGGSPEEFLPLWKEVRIQARGLPQGDGIAEVQSGNYRFKLHRVEYYLNDVEDFLSLERVAQLKASDGVSAAIAFLEQEIGERWTSPLVGAYLDLLEENKQRGKISGILPRLRGVDMRSAQAAHAVASAFDALEEYGESARHEKVALRLDPNNAHYAWYVGSYLASLGVADEAHQFYELAYSLDPSEPNRAGSYIESLLGRSEFSRAEFVALNSPPSTSGHHEIQTLAGIALALQGKNVEAEEVLRSISPQSGETTRALAQVLMALEKGDEALELLAARWNQDRRDVASGLVYVQMLREAGASGAVPQVLVQLSEAVTDEEARIRELASRMRPPSDSE